MLKCVNRLIAQDPTAKRSLQEAVDRDRMLDRLRKHGSLSLRDLRIKLPARPPGYWDARLQDLEKRGVIAVTRTGRSFQIVLRGSKGDGVEPADRSQRVEDLSKPRANHADG